MNMMRKEEESDVLVDTKVDHYIIGQSVYTSAQIVKERKRVTVRRPSDMADYPDIRKVTNDHGILERHGIELISGKPIGNYIGNYAKGFVVFLSYISIASAGWTVISWIMGWMV